MGLKDEKGNREWIGVDLDKTLAMGLPASERVDDPAKIGPPIESMVKRIHRWIEEDEYDVKIMTARASSRQRFEGETTVEHSIARVQQWCLEHLGIVLPVTCEKDHLMVQLWDDRAIQVIENTGVPIQAICERQAEILKQWEFAMKEYDEQNQAL